MQKKENNILETLETHMPEELTVCEEKTPGGSLRPYSAPQVCLVGKAKRLLAGPPTGDYYDGGDGTYGAWSLWG